MPSALNWQGPNEALTLEGSGGSLSNNTIAETNDAAYDPAAATLTYQTHGWLEFTGTWSVAPNDAAPTLDIYVAEAPGGTTYADAPLTGGADQSQAFRMALPIRKVTTAQRVVAGPFLLPPHPVKFYVDNQTGQTLSAGWTLTLHRNALEGQ